ncbi:MAG: AAA family ATPase [Pseudolabrys sp.]|nr:AAA family ATPase [Pseudolabrys sp.]
MPTSDGEQDENDADGAWRPSGEMDDDLPDDLFAEPAYTGLPFVTSGEDAARRWIIDGLIARGDVSLLIAPPFGGKSVLTAHLAHHVGRGAHWFGRGATRTGVLIIAGERAREQLRRIEALTVEHGAADVFVVNGAGLDLRRREDATARIIRTVAAARQRCSEIGLIICDTLASLSTGADENSGADMTRSMASLAAVRDNIGGHVMAVHHTPRDNPRAARGHSSIDGAADMILGLDRPNGRHRWRVLAANGLPEPFPTAEFSIGSHDGPDGSTAIVRSVAAELSPRDAAVLAGLRKAGQPINVAEFIRTIADDALPAEGDAKRKACERALEALNAAGLVLITGTGRTRLVRAAP